MFKHHAIAPVKTLYRRNFIDFIEDLMSNYLESKSINKEHLRLFYTTQTDSWTFKSVFMPLLNLFMLGENLEMHFVIVFGFKFQF